MTGGLIGEHRHGEWLPYDIDPSGSKVARFLRCDTLIKTGMLCDARQRSVLSHGVRHCPKYLSTSISYSVHGDDAAPGLCRDMIQPGSYGRLLQHSMK